MKALSVLVTTTTMLLLLLLLPSLLARARAASSFQWGAPAGNRAAGKTTLQHQSSPVILTGLSSPSSIKPFNCNSYVRLPHRSDSGGDQPDQLHLRGGLSLQHRGRHHGRRGPDRPQAHLHRRAGRSAFSKVKVVASSCRAHTRSQRPFLFSFRDLQVCCTRPTGTATTSPVVGPGGGAAAVGCGLRDPGITSTSFINRITSSTASSEAAQGAELENCKQVTS